MGTRGAWAKDFLTALGNPQPSENTIRLVAAWTRVENTNAAFNPLATIQRHGKYTKFNNCCGGEGVKNYSTRQEGIDASIMTINQNHHGYKELLQGLLTNNPARSLASGGFDTWGSRTAKVLIAYNASDFSNEPLKSESGTSTVSGGSFDVDQTQQQSNERARPDNEQQSQSFGQVSENDIRNIAKSFLGMVFIAIGGILFIVAVMRTDAAQTAAKTALKVAL